MNTLIEILGKIEYYKIRSKKELDAMGYKFMGSKYKPKRVRRKK